MNSRFFTLGMNLSFFIPKNSWCIRKRVYWSSKWSCSIGTTHRSIFRKPLSRDHYATNTLTSCIEYFYSRSVRGSSIHRTFLPSLRNHTSSHKICLCSSGKSTNLGFGHFGKALRCWISISLKIVDSISFSLSLICVADASLSLFLAITCNQGVLNNTSHERLTELTLKNHIYPQDLISEWTICSLILFSFSKSASISSLYLWLIRSQCSSKTQLRVSLLGIQCFNNSISSFATTGVLYHTGGIVFSINVNFLSIFKKVIVNTHLIIWIEHTYSAP